MNWANLGISPLTVGLLQHSIADDLLPAESAAKPVQRRILNLMQRGVSKGRAALQGSRSRTFMLTALERALSDFVRKSTPAGEVAVRIVVTGRAKDLTPETQTQVLLIMQEALLNALRHSQATRIEAEIEFRAKRLRAMVRDNGIGADPQMLNLGQASRGGMARLRERAEAISAKLSVWTKLGAGTEVEISLPL
jgi:signal transduction histidine kinase